MRWRFNSCTVGRTRHGAHFVCCGSHGGQPSSQRIKDMNEHPGLLPKGARRPRDWKPFQTKTKYFSSLLPSFTNAKQTRDSLSDYLNQQAEVEAKKSQLEEEFFGVGFDMVEKGEFYKTKND
ncbi:hypothetical protein, conserved [Angomonas deanei]|uniref:Uncharacterized protein n=1 Tax=Angomonas deanei TaxID=59799 RepID=A0A7G2C8C4_9TRYP|nr:hypothetical protein, conserved [Angomonas deanei]